MSAKQSESVYETNKSQSMSLAAQESSITDAFSGPEARFECPICLSWLRDPVLTKCGHRFCRSCMESWLERENPLCPIDNTNLEKGDIFPDNFTRREISQQKTKCPNIVRGCLEELSPLDVEMHLNVCKYRLPELPDSEKLRCNFVQFGCDEKFEDEPELQRHSEQNVQRHLTLMCQAVSQFQISNAASSSSAIAQQANFWDPPPKQEQASASVTSADLNSLMKAMYEKVIVLEQQLREKDIIVSNMSQQLTALDLHVKGMTARYCQGCYLWYFNDFKNKINAMRNNSHIMHYSPEFYTTPFGYKLCIRLNLSPKDPSYIAVLIHVMRTEHDHALDWPFSGRITISLIHPSEPFRNIKETMMTRPELEAFKRPVHEMNPKGFGYTEFALIEELFTQGYVDNKNQLLIKVQAHPV